MFKRLILLAGIFALYIWVMSAEENKSFMDKAKSLVFSYVETAKAKDIEVHVHTPDCFKKPKKMKRRWR